MKKTWLSSYDSGVPEIVNFKQESLYKVLKIKADENPKEIVFICLGKQISKISFLNLTDKIAGALQSKGLKKGDRVAVMLPNLIQFPVFFYACVKMGYVFVPINPLLAPPEISNIIKISQPRIFVFLDLFTDKINKLNEDSPVELFIKTSVTDFSSLGLKLIYPIINIIKKRVKFNYPSNLILFKQFLNSKNISLHSSEKTNENDIVVLLSTGGTTGVPKLAALSHKNISNNAWQIASLIPHIKKGSKLLAALPLFHSFGFTICLNVSMLKDFPIVLVPKFKAKTVIKLINKHKVYLMPGVPIMFAALNKYISKTQVSIKSLKECFSGGTELIPEIQDDFEILAKAKIVEAYGLTESSPAVTSNPINGIHKQGSIGIPLPSTLVQILDTDTFEKLPIDEIGEIAVKGPQVMQGYWNNEKETNKVFKNGWLLTGDLGRMDKDGYIFITGRKKEMITNSGFKIYPQEVEKVLMTHPEIEEAGVCGIPDGFRGEAVKAVVVLKMNSTLSETEIKKFCKNNLARFKVPKEVEFAKSLPKSFLGKVVRRLLNEPA